MKRLSRKDNVYRITIEEVGTDTQDSPKRLEFEVQDREDMFKVVEKLQQGSGL